MELEVKAVGGINNCFVSLPFPLIQTLHSTRSPSSPLPQILALELRSPTHPPNLWFVAWSGATSASSSAIEVSQQFAECISLPNHATVQVRAASNVPHASLVTIEPHTEDDWEILELNSDLAEAAILNQVRIVHEGMRFPLWLHGHTVITFRVASVFPKKSVVQLMPGTEVAVAPKRRKRILDSADSCDKEHTAKMLLRIQDPKGLCHTSTHVKGVELHIGLTSVAFVHPETAKHFSFNMLQLVSIVPRVSKENVNISRTKAKGGPTLNEVEDGNLTDKKGHRQAIVHLLFSESVAEGHVMVAKSLRLYLRAGLHSWMLVSLSTASGLWFGSYNLPFPGHVLIYGPPGSGKTILARTVAKSLENREDILAHIIFVSCSRLALEKVPIIRQEFANHVTEALNHAPSIVIFDDLDSVISTADSDGSQPSMSVSGLPDFLVDIMDEYGEKRRKSCGFGPIAFIASIQSLEKIPQSLSSSGRFDFHIQLPAPAASERRAMLKHELQRRHLQCSDDILLDVAVKCDGYDGYDLEILVDRAVHAAVRRFLPSNAAIYEHESPTLLREDFSQAMHDFLPVAMRDITKAASDGGRSGWDDVGGLVDIRNAIKEMIELPSKFPKTFAQAPLRLRSNVLLYGPPGCGKTHVVGAAAAASSLRFISVKGPELLNKYIGASEQAVRDIFSKAAAAAPCLLFFDEFDSIAPKRGHDNTGVTDRVVNQFLTELDGVEILTGVFVFAATSRPDLLDAALLRPGRLDRLLFCDFPSWHERLEILTVLSSKLPMARDIDLATVANMTEGFSGADLQALLSDAQLAAVHDVLDNVSTSGPKKTPVITDAHLKFTASKARPSVSEEEKRRLYSIYSQFLDSKRSVAAQSRDAKGKRATLA